MQPNCYHNHHTSWHTTKQLNNERRPLQPHNRRCDKDLDLDSEEQWVTMTKTGPDDVSGP